MPLTKFDLASNALLLIGADTVTDFAGASAESAAAAQFFQTTADNWLSLYDWQFATTTIQLSRLTDPPLNEWDAVYQAPTGSIKIQNIKVRDEPIAYDRFADKIHCNAGVNDQVFCDYTRSSEIITVDQWPPYFVELIEFALAKKFSTALAAKLDFKNSFDVDMETQFRLAKNADARQQTTKRLNMKGRGSILDMRRR
jgi:hypothetical protein